MSSWVKVSRKMLTSAIASKPEYLAVWMHLLLTASYKPGEILVGHQVVRLQAGQLVFGRVKFSQQIGVSEHTLRMALKTLEKLQQITIKSESKFSVISIVNWDKYQADSPANHQQPASNQPAINHNKEIQEIQEQIKSTSRQRADSDESFDLFWKLYPKKVGKKPAEKAWAKIKKADHESVMQGLARQVGCQQWVRDGGSYIPNPATWLNAERWNDEVKDYEQRTKASGSLSAVEQVRAGIAGRQSGREGIEQRPQQQGFIEGEFSRA